jgi:signal transduction histidine kinase
LGPRFRQRSFGDSRAQGGTGLGLSLVKHILNRHRGRLLIESVPKTAPSLLPVFPRQRPRPRIKVKRFQSLGDVIQLSSNLRKSSIDRT